MALREREIEERLRNMGFELGVAFCLKELAGENAQLEKALKECGQQLTQMAIMMNNFVTIASRMREAHQDILRKLPPDDPSLPRVNG
jgi:hypothetical protein